MAANCLTEADLDVAEIWPENWPAFELFCKLQTQWRVGMGGRCGLDYNVLLTLLERMRLNDEDHARFMADIQTLEFAALDSMNTQND